jgi:hypothetical protein
MSDIKLSTKLDRLAQRIYDLRDELPARDTNDWQRMNEAANNVSAVAVRSGQRKNNDYEHPKLAQSRRSTAIP